MPYSKLIKTIVFCKIKGTHGGLRTESVENKSRYVSKSPHFS